MHSANGRRRYNVTSSAIGWAHTQNSHCVLALGKEWKYMKHCTCNRPISINPRMHLFHIPQSSIQNRNVHISVLHGALWDMEQVHSGICELHISNLNGALWNIELVHSGICELGQWHLGKTERAACYVLILPKIRLNTDPLLCWSHF